MKVALEEVATEANFDEARYLDSNPDVAGAVRAGAYASGLSYFREHQGARNQRLRCDLSAIRRRKMEKVAACIDLTRPHVRKGDKYDFLTEELRQQTRIVDTQAVSGHAYDADIEGIIEEYRDGIVLDCGAGRRPAYYDNVINYEIVDYDTTDIIGVGESLPFLDNSLDAVISSVVLEHVRDPFACADEIVRVLRPGGKLFCAVPFLQPEHGYPHHYYNMAPQGLRALFEDSMVIDTHKVEGGFLPIWTLRWFVQSWAAGLQGTAREDFLNVRLSDLLKPVDAASLFALNWVAELPERKNFELACGSVLIAHKPEGGSSWRRSEAQALRQTIAAMRASTSWRVTKPLRALGHLLRR